MVQNTSHAVMAQRHEAGTSLDDFPTPPWGTRAGIEHALYRSDVPFRLPPAQGLTVWEPTANRGHMVTPLREYFGTVIGTDVHDYGAGFAVHDFLLPVPARDFDLVITNPPFRLATAFVRRAMQVARLGCAVLVRGTWMETVERYELFGEHPPALVAQFAERVAMVKGRLLDPSRLYPDPETGKLKRPSTATAYAWIVWHRGTTETRMRWIPPCRRQLEREGDYPEMEAVAA